MTKSVAYVISRNLPRLIPMHRLILTTVLLLLGPPALNPPAARADGVSGPYQRQVAENVNKLRGETATTRAGAAEALGFLRAYSAEAALIARLSDESFEVRRQAAMALAWCGGRGAVVGADRHGRRTAESGRRAGDR